MGFAPMRRNIKVAAACTRSIGSPAAYAASSACGVISPAAISSEPGFTL